MFDLKVGSYFGSAIAIGLSSIIGITSIPGQCMARIQRSANGGTLWMGGATLSWGNGYHVIGTGLGSTNPENFFFPVSGSVFFCAAGATCMVNILYDRRVGIPDV